MMQRVMIVGGPGSGKSTLARLMGERTGLSVIHIDHIHWQPGWVERSREEKDRLTHEVHMRDAWIFEGGHSRTYAERLARADMLIFLDLPVGLRLWRVLSRSLRYRGRTRPDLPEGCPEQFGRSTVAFVRYILTSRRAVRAKHLAICADPPPHLTVHHLSGRRSTAKFLDSLAWQSAVTEARRAPVSG